MQNRADIAIVGAGIIRLAHAWAAVQPGVAVVVFERGVRASGARRSGNFGMIWPIGQPAGELHQLALRLRSRELWLLLLGKRAYRIVRMDRCMLFIVTTRRRWRSSPSSRQGSVTIASGSIVIRCWPVPGRCSPKDCREVFSPVELAVDHARTIAALAEYLAELGVLA